MITKNKIMVCGIALSLISMQTWAGNDLKAEMQPKAIQQDPVEVRLDKLEKRTDLVLFVAAGVASTICVSILLKCFKKNS